MINLILRDSSINNTSSVSLYSLIKNKIFSIAEFELNINVADGCHITLIDDLCDFGISKSKINLILARDSNVILKFIGKFLNDTNSFEIEKNINVICKDSGANALLQYAWVGKLNRVFKFKTTQKHLAPNSSSELVIKSVLFDESKLFCENLIRIEKNAQKVVAIEQNKNLLIGDKSRAISIPKLEVEANDVSCRHGAAFSKLNSEHLFYLQSRGLSKQDSEQLLIDAFLIFS